MGGLVHIWDPPTLFSMAPCPYLFEVIDIRMVDSCCVNDRLLVAVMRNFPLNPQTSCTLSPVSKQIPSRCWAAMWVGNCYVVHQPTPAPHSKYLRHSVCWGEFWVHWVPAMSHPRAQTVIAHQCCEPLCPEKQQFPVVCCFWSPVWRCVTGRLYIESGLLLGTLIVHSRWRNLSSDVIYCLAIFLESSYSLPDERLVSDFKRGPSWLTCFPAGLALRRAFSAGDRGPSH